MGGRSRVGRPRTAPESARTVVYSFRETKSKHNYVLGFVPFCEEHGMYATIERRTVNHARLQETGERAARDFFPALRQAAGFVDFNVIADANGVNEAVTFWETRAQADAF